MPVLSLVKYNVEHFSIFSCSAHSLAVFCSSHVLCSASNSCVGDCVSDTVGDCVGYCVLALKQLAHISAQKVSLMLTFSRLYQ